MAVILSPVPFYDERCMTDYLLVYVTATAWPHDPFFDLIMVRVLLMSVLLCLLEIT